MKSRKGCHWGYKNAPITLTKDNIADFFGLVGVVLSQQVDAPVRPKKLKLWPYDVVEKLKE